jgi:hypothetical protein
MTTECPYDTSLCCSIPFTVPAKLCTHRHGDFYKGLSQIAAGSRKRDVRDGSAPSLKSSSKSLACSGYCDRLLYSTIIIHDNITDS